MTDKIIYEIVKTVKQLLLQKQMTTKLTCTKRVKKIIFSEQRFEANKFIISFEKKKPCWFIFFEDGSMIEAVDFQSACPREFLSGMFNSLDGVKGFKNYHPEVGTYDEWYVTDDPLIVKVWVNGKLYKFEV